MIDRETYWAEAMAEVTSRPPQPEVDELPIRSTDFSDGYGVKLTSLGDYRLFAYYSVPKAAGPHPAIYHAPGYASVVPVPPYEERRRHAVLTLCARGQRLSDKPYAAAFPGLLTDRVDDPSEYPLRGYVADSCRGVDFLRLRAEVDGARIVVVGATSRRAGRNGSATTTARTSGRKAAASSAMSPPTTAILAGSTSARSLRKSIPRHESAT